LVIIDQLCQHPDIFKNLSLGMAVENFDTAGFCVVEQALSPDIVRSFVRQIESELALEEGTVGK
jgi:hypothetical protein